MDEIEDDTQFFDGDIERVEYFHSHVKMVFRKMYNPSDDHIEYVTIGEGELYRMVTKMKEAKMVSILNGENE